MNSFSLTLRQIEISDWYGSELDYSIALYFYQAIVLELESDSDGWLSSVYGRYETVLFKNSDSAELRVEVFATLMALMTTGQLNPQRVNAVVSRRLE